MRRPNSPYVGTMFMATGAASAILGQAMIHGVPAIGEAVGAAIANGINRKRARDWSAAIEAKADQAEKLLSEFENLRRQWIVRGSAHDSATVGAIQGFKRELSRAFDADTVFEAYDLLERLVTKMRQRLTADRAVSKALFTANVKRKTAKLLEDARG